MMTTEELAIVHFCARECKLQMSGELSVGWMVDAWVYAQRSTSYLLDYQGDFHYPRPTVLDVLTIGRLCEPHENLKGFRTCWVKVGVSTIDWQYIPSQIDNLIQHGTDLTPAEFFKAYEEIHPFVDGNGRSGQILFNWLNGTLHHPEFAPNFWNDPRRVASYGS